MDYIVTLCHLEAQETSRSVKNLIFGRFNRYPGLGQSAMWGYGQLVTYTTSAATTRLCQRETHNYLQNQEKLLPPHTLLVEQAGITLTTKQRMLLIIRGAGMQIFLFPLARVRRLRWTRHRTSH